MTREEKARLIADLNVALAPFGVKIVFTATPAAANDNQEWLTSKQAARLLGLSPRTLEEWRGKGIGPKWERFSFCGRESIFYARSEIEKFRPRR